MGTASQPPLQKLKKFGLSCISINTITKNVPINTINVWYV